MRYLLNLENSVIQILFLIKGCCVTITVHKEKVETMLQNEQANDRPNKGNSKNDSDSQAGWWWIVVAALILLGVVAFVGLALIDSTKRINFLTVNALSALIFVAVAMQVYVYRKQWKVMERQWEATRKLVEQNERAVTAAERIAEIAHEGERAYIGITKLTVDTLAVGQNPTLRITWCNAGKTPAWHFLGCPMLVVGEKPSGHSYYMKRDLKDVETSFIPAGKDVTVPYLITDLEITTEILAEVESGRQRLFACIYALYIDFQGQRRLFEARAVYETDTGAFTDCYDDYQGETKPN